MSTQQPEALPPRRHQWRELFTVDPGRSGCQETHRACVHCDLVKITVHPPAGLPYRAWMTPFGRVWHGDATPPCLPAAEPQGDKP